MDALEVGDVAHLTAVLVEAPTTGTIARLSAELQLTDATGYSNVDAVLVEGAGPNGSDLYTTISSIAGDVATLAAAAEVAVTNAPVGRAVNPTTVTCKVTAPDGTVGHPSTTNDDVGRYHADYTITQDGVHHYEFAGTGSNVGVVRGVFEAQPTAFSKLSPRALCTLDDLKQFLGDIAHNDDANLVAAINSASSRIYRASNFREFVARNAVRDPSTGIVTVAAETRRFPITQPLVDGRLLWVGDLAATTWNDGSPQTLALATAETESGSPTTLVTADLGYQPVSREPWEPITRILIPTSVNIVAGWHLQITAIWGFPAIPDDIREACKQLAFGSYLRDPRRRSRQVDESGQDLPRTLIGAAMRTARDYSATPPLVALQAV